MGNYLGTVVQSAGAVEYTNYISAEEYDSLYKCSGFDTKQSDNEAPVILELWGMAEYPLIAIAPWSTLAQSGSTW